MQLNEFAWSSCPELSVYSVHVYWTPLGFYIICQSNSRVQSSKPLRCLRKKLYLHGANVSKLFLNIYVHMCMYCKLLSPLQH